MHLTIEEYNENKKQTNINHTVETIPKSNVNIIEGKTDTNT
jgi:hypothetical protein